MNPRQTDKDINALKENKLEVLEWKNDFMIPSDLDCTSLAEALKDNTSLKTLILQHYPIDCANAILLSKALEKNQTLTKLDLHNSKLKSEGAVIIAKALQSHPTLETLILSRNQIEKIDELAPLLMQNKTIRVLNLADNRIGDGQILKNELSKNKILTELALNSNSLEFEDVCAILDALGLKRFGMVNLIDNSLGPHSLQEAMDQYKMKCQLLSLGLVPVIRMEKAEQQKQMAGKCLLFSEKIGIPAPVPSSLQPRNKPQ